ncbi:hypothetical protein BVX97_04120 [bacterium E08(2017)]|nr:hypothetical protein BVX97_04120 [bacterium E08(2017)]
MLGAMALSIGCSQTAQERAASQRVKVVKRRIFELSPEVLLSAEKLAEIIAKEERKPSKDNLVYRRDLYERRLINISQQYARTLTEPERAAAFVEQKAWADQHVSSSRGSKRSPEEIEAFIEVLKERTQLIEQRNNISRFGGKKENASISTSELAVSNFLATIQAQHTLPNHAFGKAEVNTSPNAIVITAPGFNVTIGNAAPDANALLSQSYFCYKPSLRVVVQHLPHKHMESIPTTHDFSPKPSAPQPARIDKVPILFKRPTKHDIQVLLDSFADVGIVLEAKEQGTPRKVRDTYFPKVPSSLLKK